MRRRFLTIAIASAMGIMAVPALAGEADQQFEGLIERDENTYLGLDIQKQSGKRFIAADGLGWSPVTCVDGTQTYTIFLTGKRIRINDRGRFKSSQTGVTLGGPTPLKISGKVTGRSIRGSVGWRITEGTPDPSDDCYTGQLAYRVSRDIELDPPKLRPVP